MACKSERSFGFTIVELLVVIVVIGILAAVTIISYTGISNKAIAASLQSDLENVSKLLKLDQVEGSAYPTTLESANGGKGIPASPGTTYQYSVDNTTTPQIFCITATKNGQSYSVTNDSSPTEGACLNTNLTLELDSGNSASYPGSGTTWTDLTGGGHNGTLMNGVSYLNSNGGVLSLDGVDDYMQIGPVPNIGLSNKSVSWGIWVYPISTSGNIMSMSSTTPQGAWNMPPIAATSQKFRGKIWSNNYLYSSTYALNSWYYVVLVFDYSTASQKLYVNGVLQGSQTGIVYSASGADNYMYLGQMNPGADNTGMFAGRIGEFKVYGNRALSDSEVQNSFNVLRGRYGV